MSENVMHSPIGNQRPRKPSRGLIGQVSTIIFQPAKFFAEMPRIQDNRQWAWIGLLLLVIIGLNVVQQNDANNTPSAPVDGGFMGDPTMGGGMGMDMMGGGFEDPFMSSDGGSGGSGGEVNTSTKWEMALVAGAGMVFVWFGQALVLSQVSLFKGQAPAWSDNLQIVVWASVPLGLLALFQMFFRWTGGEIGPSGLSGLLVETSFYQSANPFLQAVLETFASNLTLFWVWSLALIYVGARHVLQGQPIASLLAVVMWVILLVAIPSIINPPQAEPEEGLSDFGGDFGEFGEFPFDDGMNGEFDPSLNGDFSDGDFSEDFNQGEFGDDMPTDDLGEGFNEDSKPSFDENENANEMGEEDSLMGDPTEEITDFDEEPSENSDLPTDEANE